jgi:hypothetical protein
VRYSIRPPITGRLALMIAREAAARFLGISSQGTGWFLDLKHRRALAGVTSACNRWNSSTPTGRAECTTA